MQLSSVKEPGAGRLATFERDRRHLLAVAFRLVGTEADAQDVVQDAWIRYSLADLRDISNVSAWLTTVVSRLCLDQLRRRRTVVLEEVVPPAVAVSREDPEEIARPRIGVNR